MDVTVQINWVPAILLVTGSMLVFLFFPKLKIFFNETTGFKGKNLVFGLVTLAPFTLLAGVLMAHSNYKFLTNWEMQVEECVSKSNLAEPYVVSVESDGDTFVKLKSGDDSKIVWCQHDYQNVVKYF